MINLQDKRWLLKTNLSLCKDYCLMLVLTYGCMYVITSYIESHWMIQNSPFSIFRMLLSSPCSPEANGGCLATFLACKDRQCSACRMAVVARGCGGANQCWADHQCHFSGSRAERLPLWFVSFLTASYDLVHGASHSACRQRWEIWDVCLSPCQQCVVRGDGMLMSALLFLPLLVRHTVLGWLIWWKPWYEALETSTSSHLG